MEAPSTALLTDRYELTMIDAALAAGARAAAVGSSSSPATCRRPPLRRASPEPDACSS